MIASPQTIGPCTLWFGRRCCVVILLCLLFSNPSRLALAEEQTLCQADEVPVAVTISHQPLDSLEFLDLSIQGSRFRQVGSNTTGTKVKSFSYYQRLLDKDFNDVPVVGELSAVCVPGDQCLVVMVQVNALPLTDGSTQRYALSADEISIVYDGVVVSSNLQGPLPYGQNNGVMFAGELGDCEVLCDSGEALLEIQAATGSIAEYDWQVFDDATGQMIAHCPGSSSSATETDSCYWTMDQFYSDKVCLPSDSCYTLVIGQMYLENTVADDNVVTVVFDGNPSVSLENMRYVSVKLNDGTSTGCDASGCGSDSKPLEMFVFREFMQMFDHNFTWIVSNVDAEQGPSNGMLDTGVTSFGDRAFYYHQACIPNPSSCIQFQLVRSSEDIGALNFTELKDSVGNITYRLVLDGITYSEVNVQHLLHAGNCSASHVCPNEAMVQVDLSTGSTWKLGDFQFEVSTRSDNGVNGLNYNYKSILPGERYRFFPCFEASLLQNENGSCTAFFVDAEKFLDGNAEYNVYINGVELSERNMVLEEQSSDNLAVDRIATPLDGSCEMLSSTNGSSAGIMWVMVSLLLLGCLA